ncbi:hypothetical protein OS493_039523 [Desmophyllum pertusum]|uniref:Uncharacterized protein n=1 Tax=Desmophyllum pertusum TaxID=174260 RepID=A0A9W9Z670_9CNID|nr:hypothetical protein OS493_039523 [Desmophyllum pertusum]
MLKLSSEEDVDRILKTSQESSSGKQICSVPIQLCFFSNLQKVILCGNQLSDIPWSVIYLKQLKELDISFNALHILPRIVGYIPTLEVLFRSETTSSPIYQQSFSIYQN